VAESELEFVADSSGKELVKRDVRAWSSFSTCPGISARISSSPLIYSHFLAFGPSFNTNIYTLHTHGLTARDSTTAASKCAVGIA
jgi:hypothetical protein